MNPSSLNIDSKRRDFLKTSMIGSAVAVSGLSIPTYASTRQPQGLNRRGRQLKWQNWSNHIHYSPKSIVHLDSIEKAIETVKATRYSSIRVAGSGHSFNDIVPGQALLTMKNLKKVFVNKNSMTVSSQSGATLNDVIAELKKNQLALPNMGEIDKQTVAGLIATGTKGTGAQFGSFSDLNCLVGMNLIDGLGNFHEYNFDHTSHQDVSRALRLNLGALGVVTQVTFRVTPEFNLKEEIILTDLNDACRETHPSQNYRYGFHYFPFSDLAKCYKNNITTEKINLESHKNRKFKERYLENIVADSLLKVGSINPKAIPRITQMFASRFKEETYVDSWDHIMIKERTMKHHEMNYTIPASEVYNVLSKFKVIVSELARRNIYYSDLPAHVRYLRADKDVLLSSAEGPGTFAHININAHCSQDNYELLFKLMEDVFLQVNGKPHWGKLFYQSPKAVYTGIREFEEIRKKMDPLNKFRNKFIEKWIS